MFDIKKFFSGFNITSGEKLGKILFFGILIVIGLAVYHQLTRPTQNIVAQRGSQVTVISQDKKRSWWIPSPFVELYGYKENDRQGTGAKFGGRFEW